MTPINTAIHFKHIPLALPQFVKNSLEGYQVILKVVGFAYRYFGISSSLTLTAWGGKVIWVDKSKAVVAAVSHNKNPVESFINRIRTYVDVKDHKKYILQGSFFFGCGVTAAASSLHDLGLVNLGKAIPFLNLFSNASFLLGHLVALDLNVRTYHRALNSADSTEARQLKTSSITGILSNLNYIFFSSLSILGLVGSVSLIFGCIGCFFGCIKILVDFLNHRNNTKHKSS